MPADEKVLIYHNPRCSTSRATLALLKEKGIEPQVIDYLQTPPSVEDVKRLIRQLGVPPHDLLRTKEAPYKELGLSKESTPEEIAQAIATHPILLERPVVVKGQKAALGRPPEKVLGIL